MGASSRKVVSPSACASQRRRAIRGTRSRAIDDAIATGTLRHVGRFLQGYNYSLFIIRNRSKGTADLRTWSRVFDVRMLIRGDEGRI